MSGKQLWKFAAGILLATLLGGAVWMLWPAPEPVYQGKPLSYWLSYWDARFAFDPPSKAWEAEAALSHIGSNALPILLMMLKERNSALGSQVRIFLTRHRVLDYNPKTPEIDYVIALHAFEALGQQASNAVPELLKIYQLPKNSSLQKSALLRSLAAIGPAAAAAVPAVAQALVKAPSVEDRRAAAFFLGSVQREPEISIAALVAALRDPSLDVQATAVSCLGNFGTRAKSALPDITQWLEAPGIPDDKSRPYRTVGRGAILKIGGRPEKSSSIPN